MDVRPIHTAQDHEWALAEVARYFDNEPEVGSEDGNRFEILSTLIADYERRHFPMPKIDPIDALRAFIEDSGRSQKDLADLLGSAPRASEVLNRKRSLTIEMVHKLNQVWGVPAELLIVPCRKAA